MSHVHNLFHKSHANEDAQSAASSENVVTFANVAPADLKFPEFPVEEAILSPENRLVYHTDSHTPAADRFRLLRMRLREHWNVGKLKKLLITSPLAHDGKSTIVVNLATAMTAHGKATVLVVESDLHHSSLSGSLGLRPWVGLTRCLSDDSTPPLSAIRRIEPLGWYLLPAGEHRKNPTELLQTPVFGQMMQNLSHFFDWILIDSPPVIPLTDSLSLQQHADASLLVVRAGITPGAAVEQSIELLGKENIVGIVLNGVKARDHLYYQYYGQER